MSRSEHPLGVDPTGTPPAASEASTAYFARRSGASNPDRYADLVRVPAIDIYVTFRCNLRCRHCFVGEALDRRSDLHWDLLAAMLDVARPRWGTEEVSFLGGEPTLYPHLLPAIEHSQRLGLGV